MYPSSLYKKKRNNFYDFKKKNSVINFFFLINVFCVQCETLFPIFNQNFYNSFVLNNRKDQRNKNNKGNIKDLFKILNTHIYDRIITKFTIHYFLQARVKFDIE